MLVHDHPLMARLAQANGQTKLKQEIDADLKELETEPGAP